MPEEFDRRFPYHLELTVDPIGKPGYAVHCCDADTLEHARDITSALYQTLELNDYDHDTVVVMAIVTMFGHRVARDTYLVRTDLVRTNELSIFAVPVEGKPPIYGVDWAKSEIDISQP